jgi:glycosyltransferase involved in cell wall biosynthesis
MISPAEIRRMMYQLRYTVPIVGYTHGSHWDPTDLFRQERFPGLHLLDLANLASLDRVLVVSDYMRGVLEENILKFNEEVAEQVASRVRVVGLPINIPLIEQYRQTSRLERTTILFNHAPSQGKRPDVFFDLMRTILAERPVDLLVTRRFERDDPGALQLRRLMSEFGDRVLLGADLAIGDYFKSLWRTHIQVSTAEHESLGVATLEAMYTGNCTLIPRIGSYPEICQMNSGALYQGIAELSEKLRFLIDNSGIRQALSNELLASAKRYAPDVVVDAIMAVLEEVTGRSK